MTDLLAPETAFNVSDAWGLRKPINEALDTIARIKHLGPGYQSWYCEFSVYGPILFSDPVEGYWTLALHALSTVDRLSRFSVQASSSEAFGYVVWRER